MFGEILKKLREKEGLSQEELGKILGISKSTVGMYEQGKRMPQSNDVLKKIAEHFNVTLDYLMGFNNENSIIKTIDLEKLGLRKVSTRRFPMIGKIACGEPIMCEEDYETYVEASGEIKADFCVTAQGDSMVNARIFDGDVVFIRAQEIVENGEIAAVIVNDDEITLKRFYYYPELDRIVLEPENPIYRPMIYDGDALVHIRVLGKAVAFMSNIH